MFEQYKLYAADVANIGSRYATMNSFYMSVLAALTGLLALTEGTKPLKDIGSMAGVLIPAFSAITCVVWANSIRGYRSLFAAKFKVLRELEQKLEAKPYTRESEELNQGSALTGIDGNLPLVMCWVYTIIAGAMFVRMLVRV
jgi:hypothetical protein